MVTDGTRTSFVQFTHIPYWAKIRQTKLSKIRIGDENFVQRKFCPLCYYKSQAKFTKFRLVCETFVRLIFYRQGMCCCNTPYTGYSVEKI